MYFEVVAWLWHTGQAIYVSHNRSIEHEYFEMYRNVPKECLWLFY